MSIQDKAPAENDETRTVYPLTFFKGEEDINTHDWRPQPLPAGAVEEPAPKSSSAPEPAASSESQTKVEATVQVAAAPHPVEKASTPSKAAAPGKPGSSSPKTTGS